MYKLHSPADQYYGSENPLSLEKVCILAKSMGLDMVEKFIPDGLNTFEDQHPDKAVIFDVRSEDVVWIER